MTRASGRRRTETTFVSQTKAAMKTRVQTQTTEKSLIPNVTRKDGRTSASLQLLSSASSITHHLRHSGTNRHETRAATDQDRRAPLKHEGGSAPAASSHSPSASSKRRIRLQPAYRCSVVTLHFLSGRKHIQCPRRSQTRTRYIILTKRDKAVGY